MTTDKQTPTIVQLISTFSDYAGAIGRLHQDALTKYVDKHVELFTAVKPLVKDDMKAPALHAVLVKMAEDAGKVWTLKVDALAQVLWFGRNHTAARLATYSGAKIKAEETPTSPGYVSWLRRLVNEEITEKGEETEKGATARKNRDSAAAKLAVAKPDAVVEVDYLKDMEGLADAEKLRALLVLQANLAADIELTERKLRKSVKGQKAIKEARTAVTAARRRAVA